MISAFPGTQVSVALTLGTPGLTGTLAVQVVDAGQQTVAVARTTAGITEFPAGSGVYGVLLTAPEAPGLYAVIWDTGLPLSPQTAHYDQLTVVIVNPQSAGGWSWEDETGWVFDEESGSSGVDISTGAPGSNPIPDAAYVLAASKLDFPEYGYSQVDGPGGVQELVDRAESAFYRITGQTLDEIDAKDAPLVRRVIQGLTEQMAMSSSAETLETMQDWDLIQSFSAGPYSETRRSAADMIQAKMLNPIPWLSDALWSMLSPDRFDFYTAMFGGQHAPAWQASDVFWEAGNVFGNLDGPSPGGWWGA